MTKPRALTAKEFFDMAVDGGGVTDAALACAMHHMTVWRVAHGNQPRVETLKPLEEWSRTLPAARKAGVYLSAAKTLGLAS